MTRWIVAVLLASVVQFFWGFLFWTNAPTGLQMMKGVPEEDRLLQALKEQNLSTGVYFLPWYGASEEDNEAMVRKHESGPLVQVIYHAEGVPAMDPKIFAFGYLHMVGGCLLASILLCLAGPGLPSYLARVLFVSLLGVFAAFALNFAQPIWFHHPWEFHLLQSVYDVVNWIVAGLILAAFIRREA